MIIKTMSVINRPFLEQKFDFFGCRKQKVRVGGLEVAVVEAVFDCGVVAGVLGKVSLVSEGSLTDLKDLAISDGIVGTHFAITVINDCRRVTVIGVFLLRHKGLRAAGTAETEILNYILTYFGRKLEI